MDFEAQGFEGMRFADLDLAELASKTLKFEFSRLEEIVCRKLHFPRARILILGLVTTKGTH